MIQLVSKTLCRQAAGECHTAEGGNAAEDGYSDHLFDCWQADPACQSRRTSAHLRRQRWTPGRLRCRALMALPLAQVLQPAHCLTYLRIQSAPLNDDAPLAQALQPAHCLTFFRIQYAPLNEQRQGTHFILGFMILAFICNPLLSWDFLQQNHAWT